MKTMAAGKFKAHCLAVMDEVELKREPVLLTKKGRPVVKLVPLDQGEDPLAVFRFPGVHTIGDVVAPAFDLEDWDMLK